MKRFYITTAIPYVNARPHVGFALEAVQADVIARYRRLKGDDVFFLTGTDENALKNVLAARENGIETGKLVYQNSRAFRALKETLNLSWDDFIRTTERRHVNGAQKFWQACKEEDIFKKAYKGLYCVGCEEFKTEKELVNGCCPEHPDQKLETVEEENYFFRLTNYQKKLEQLIASGQLQIVPESRKNEVLSFIGRGLEDFSISRSRERAQEWGIPVPGDVSQIIYVWFDALTNYITGLGYADDGDSFKKYWQENEDILHVIGKGITRFHAVYWPAMLLSAGLRLPKKIFVHGYLTVNGQKISKTLGNVIDPAELVKKYGTDAIRYYLLREVSPWEDGDFSIARLEECYSGQLAHELGNLVSRLFGSAKKFGEINVQENAIADFAKKSFQDYESAVENFRFNEALAETFKLIKRLNQYFDEGKPWKFKALDGKAERFFSTVVFNVGQVASMLLPFLPESAEKIFEYLDFDYQGQEPWRVFSAKKEIQPLFRKLQ